MTKTKQEIQILREEFLRASDNMTHSAMSMTEAVPRHMTEKCNDVIDSIAKYKEKRHEYFEALMEYEHIRSRND